MARIAGVVMFLGLAVAFVIGVGIALVALDAKESNDIVGVWLDVCRFLTDPFRGIFDLERGREHLQIGINWGIAALAYLLAAILVARVLRRLRRPSMFSRRTGTA
ncbi:MAG TPA: hypothetical protein VGR12_00115 [Solirubrobacteraceae bacterium]|nr:hypothetical protein [Solirubrobacteraceae bacterium]